MRKAVYAGSFDPVTSGHMWMIAEGANLFDELVVVVGHNHEKHYMFSLGERVEMVHAAIKEAGLDHKVTVCSMIDQFLVKFALEQEINFMIRGVRDVADFDAERRLRNVNELISPNVSTVFLIPPPSLTDVSSSMVKGMMGNDGWEDIVSNFVPTLAMKRLYSKR